MATLVTVRARLHRFSLQLQRLGDLRFGLLDVRLRGLELSALPLEHLALVVANLREQAHDPIDRSSLIRVLH